MKNFFLVLFLFFVASTFVYASPKIKIDPEIKYYVSGSRINVSAEITDPKGVSETRLYFKSSDEMNYMFVDMAKDGNKYTGTIPAPSKETKAIDYIVLVKNVENKVFKTQSFRVADKNNKELPAWQTSENIGNVYVKTELAKAPEAIEGFSDSIVLDTVESTAKFGVVAGIISADLAGSSSGAVGAGTLAGSSTAGGAAAGSTTGIAVSGGTVAATTAGVSTATLVGGTVAAVAVGGGAAVAGGSSSGGGSSDSPADNDKDGYNENKDCNDNDPAINPGVAENCFDNVDNNCNGSVDENCVAYQNCPTLNQNNCQNVPECKWVSFGGIQGCRFNCVTFTGVTSCSSAYDGNQCSWTSTSFGVGTCN